MARVFVGLSGGVDSAVSAALLKEAGHDVVGCFIRIWRPEFLECTWREDRLDAMRVAAHLSIPFRELDLSDEYERDVIRPMIADYADGRTPNPDTACNRYVKFDAFLEWAIAEGADSIATGHYARVTHDPVRLMTAVDPLKDQSYFLARVPARSLERAIFPLGEMRKSAVRAMATALGLPVARKHDSQGLCFVGDVSIAEFLSRYAPPRVGSIVTKDGHVVGEHRGAMFYTRGQRQGLGISSETPYYVIATDPIANTVTVSHDARDAAVSVITLTDLNAIETLETGSSYSCVVRYHTPATRGIFSSHAGATTIALDESIVVAPGQTCVLYREDRVIASGIVC